MTLLSFLIALPGAAAGYGLDRLLRQCSSEAVFPMARYTLSRRRWWLAGAGALVFVGCAQLFSPAVAGCLIFFLLMLIGASCIDFDEMVIPDLFTLGLAVAGLSLSTLVPALHQCGAWNAWNCLRSAAAAALGLAVGSSLVLWFGLIGECVLGKEVLGFGDVKFVGAIGAFCGWQGAVFSLFGGAVIALIVIVGARSAALLGFGDARWERSGAGATGGDLSCSAGGAQFPFGPMLAAAAALYTLALRMPVDAYLAQYRALF
jgi:leader peptidase (prepilin peptidase)/N-methyltransferase